MLPLTLIRTILNIPNCLGGCPIALALLYPRAPVPSELSAYETNSVFVVQVIQNIQEIKMENFDKEDLMIIRK